MDPTAANLESQSQHSHGTHEEEEGGHDMYDEAENADDDALARDEENDIWGDLGHVNGNGNPVLDVTQGNTCDGGGVTRNGGNGADACGNGHAAE